MHSLRSRQVHFFVAAGRHNWDGGNVGIATKEDSETGTETADSGVARHHTWLAYSSLESLTDPITQYISQYADRVSEGGKHVEFS